MKFWEKVESRSLLSKKIKLEVKVLKKNVGSQQSDMVMDGERTFGKDVRTEHLDEPWMLEKESGVTIWKRRESKSWESLSFQTDFKG